LLRIVDEVEEELHQRSDREVSSSLIGELITEKLKLLDKVAYVRFASVYRRFSTLEELVDDARAVIDAKRFEDPTQGRLFVERALEAEAKPPAAKAPTARRGRDSNGRTPKSR
jgi:hypothetical protein